jgi:hypothetical protein
MDEKDWENVVIFGGNLNELHQRYPDRKYELAGDFFKGQTNFYDSIEENTRIELSGEGYDGLIRANLFKSCLISLFGTWSMQGVPVKRIDIIL